MARRGFWVRVGMGVINSTLTVFSRHTWQGAEHIPATGGAIVAANHISQVDPMVMARFVYATGRVPRFLTKASVLQVPLMGPALRSTGQIPVHRGSIDAARSVDEAAAALRDGDVVVVYPEGTTTRDPDFWPMHGRTGVARLALATGAPVIPVAQWGAQRLQDPVAHSVRPRPRTPVSVLAGPPMELSAWRERAAGGEPDRTVLSGLSDAIMYRIRELLTELRDEQPPEQLYAWPPKRPATPDGEGGR